MITRHELLSLEDGGTAPAYVAIPPNASAQTPGVVVVMHVWGIDASVRAAVEGLAQAGYAAIAPDLYARLNAPSGDGESDYTKFVPLARSLEPHVVDRDLLAAASWLRQAHPKGRLGITGFCLGGAITLRQAIEQADTYAVAASWYGRVEGLNPRRVGIPLLGNYGERDTGIPADDVRAFFSAVPAPTDLKIYSNAGHAFFDSPRATYVPDSAADAWQRTIAFFTKYLRA